MKSYFKGLICGLILAVAIMCIPAVAENISVTFNGFRLNVNGVDIAQWGESYTLYNGAEVPYSIIYNDTTYLPLRKIGELTGKHIAYNGDTGTVSISDLQTEIKEISEKPDINGNVWKYYTFKSGDDVYLGVKDETRGYERIYKTMSSDPETAVTVTDEAIYFVKDAGRNKYVDPYNEAGVIQKILFLTDADNQDGEEVDTIQKINKGTAIFDNEYLYFTGYSAGSNGHSYIMAQNILDPELKVESYNCGTWQEISDIHLKESGLLGYNLSSSTAGLFEYEITFDKTQNKFLNPLFLNTL